MILKAKMSALLATPLIHAPVPPALCTSVFINTMTRSRLRCLRDNIKGTIDPILILCSSWGGCTTWICHRQWCCKSSLLFLSFSFTSLCSRLLSIQYSWSSTATVQTGTHSSCFYNAGATSLHKFAKRKHLFVSKRSHIISYLLLLWPVVFILTRWISTLCTNDAHKLSFRWIICYCRSV